MTENNASSPSVMPAPETATWGGWFSSIANTAYTSVVGIPENYHNLTPTASLTDEGEGTKQFGEVDSATKQALWQQLASVVGMDVMNMRLSLPIWVFEPTTALTRMSETFEYSDLLDRAATCQDPVLRDCLVAAFVISAFSHTERVKKPFNPVLGETFEYINPVNDMKFYAEQVSHHPPVSVSRCEGRGWVSGEVVDIQATFNGNSIEVCNIGSRYINLTATNDRYTWTLPKALVSNLFVGGTFVDHFGSLEIHNNTTKSVSVLELSKCGWFSAGRHDVTGHYADADGIKLVTFKGAWHKYLDCERVGKAKGEGANRLWMAGSHLLSEEEGGGDTGILANCTKFTQKVLALDPEYAAELPPTDSRLRPDRLALQNGERTVAAQLKIEVEQRQRDRNAAVTAGAKEREAKYFKRASEDEQIWEHIGNYWAESRSFEGDKRDAAQLW